MAAPPLPAELCSFRFALSLICRFGQRLLLPSISRKLTFCFVAWISVRRIASETAVRKCANIRWPPRGSATKVRFKARRNGLFMQGSFYSLLGQVSGSRAALLCVTALLGLGSVPSAFAADITVASPVNGTTVPSPVWVRAHNVGCNGLTPTSFVYSVDNSATLVNGVTLNDIDTTAAMSSGTHTIHYKSWVNGTECPTVSTTFTVTGGSSSGSSGSTSNSTPPASGAGITVTSPANGATLSSPITVQAHNTGCDGKAPVSFDYSIDNNATLFPGSVSDIDATGVAIGSGTHTIHFKSWLNGGAICPVVSSTFTISGSSSSGGGTTSTGSSSGGTLPSNAVASANLDGLGSWATVHDTGTPGSSSGSMVYPAKTPSYDDAREFYTTYSSGGGQRFHVSFDNNATSMNFALDTYVYVTDPTKLQNLELDLNQVTSDGKTIMFNTQCSSDSKTWEYTVITNGSDHWTPSNVPCNTLTWAPNTWHHIQIGYHRDNSGNVTHDWVNFDGTHSVFSNTTKPASESLGWAKGTLLTNVQVDGLSKGSGSITVYVHKMTFYHW
jgi:hypothetical protein